MHTMPDLSNRVAIVTGAGRGLGRASARAFAAAGGSVVVVSRTESDLLSLAGEIGGDRCGVVAGDVSRPATARRAIEVAVDRFGGVDILMNNAAVVGPLRRMEEVDEAEWEAALAVNLKGAFLFAREVVPHMRRRGKGAIINVTSGLGSFVLSPFGMYCIAKAGLNHLTRILALELREAGIAVNALDPGVMDTPMQEEIRGAGPSVLGDETWTRFVGFKEKGILDPVQKTAQLALFLAAPPAGVSGEIGDAEHYRRFGFSG